MRPLQENNLGSCARDVSSSLDQQNDVEKPMNYPNDKSNRIALRSVVVTVALMWPAAFGHAGEATVNGRLENIGPFRVLRVWGTPQEMGYAHGYLLGKQIVSAQNATITIMPPQMRAHYDKAMTPLLTTIETPQRTLEELKGILQGIKASHNGPATIENLKRSIRLSDLILHNAGDTTRAYQCSGFTAWGDKTSEHGVITTRNFDFYARYDGALDDQLILVRQPTGRHQVATVTWPGYLGAFTGVNDAGVCTFMHDGTGPKLSIPSGKYRPVALVLKEILESSTADAAHENAHRLLTQAAPYPFSYMLRVITPRTKNPKHKPVWIFRIDADGLGKNPVGNGSCITTNHYLTPAFGAADNAEDWSLERFRRLAGHVSATITPQIAWEAQHSVSVSNQKSGTLHALIVYPESRLLDLGFAKSGAKGIVSATSGKPTRIKFSELFSRPNR